MSGAVEFEVECSQEPAVIRVRGDIDIATSERFASAIEEVRGAEGTDLVVDLAEVDFIDSSGLAVLVNTANAGHRIVVRNASTVLRRVIDATGLAAVLQVEP